MTKLTEIEGIGEVGKWVTQAKSLPTAINY